MPVDDVRERLIRAGAEATRRVFAGAWVADPDDAAAVVLDALPPALLLAFAWSRLTDTEREALLAEAANGVAVQNGRSLPEMWDIKLARAAFGVAFGSAGSDPQTKEETT